ncbi:hypothetical protein D3C77_456790 [compost metagenome]
MTVRPTKPKGTNTACSQAPVNVIIPFFRIGIDIKWRITKINVFIRGLEIPHAWNSFEFQSGNSFNKGCNSSTFK